MTVALGSPEVFEFNNQRLLAFPRFFLTVGEVEEVVKTSIETLYLVSFSYLSSSARH